MLSVAGLQPAPLAPGCRSDAPKPRTSSVTFRPPRAAGLSAHWCRQRALCVVKAAAGGVVDAEETGLVSDEPQYLTFDMVEGLQLLVAELPDGRLDLHSVFLLEPDTDGYSQPKIEGDVPKGPQLYQWLPWQSEKSGDAMKGQGIQQQLSRVVLVAIKSQEPYELDLSQVFVFESESRTMYKAEVLGDPDNLQDPVLRVSDDRVVVEDTSVAMPFPEVVARQTLVDMGEDPDLIIGPVEEPVEEVDAMNDTFDVPDVPAVDLQ